MDKNFLKARDYSLRMAQFAVKKTVLAAGDNLSVRFFKPRKANTDGVNVSTEGTTDINLTEVGRGYVDCLMKQLSALAKITDIVQAIDLVDTVDLYSKTMGADAALCYDEIMSNAVACNPAVAAHKVGAGNKTLYGSNGAFERFAGVAGTNVSATDYASLAALSASNAKITRAAHLACMTQLMANDVKQVNGRYPVIIPPQVIMDIRQDTTWLTAVQQSDVQKLYKWAAMELDGGVFIETTRPWREATGTYGTRSNTGSVFGVIYLGADAIGIPELSNKMAGGSGDAPSINLITKPDHANPQGKWVQIAWKAFFGAGLLWTNEASDCSPAVLLRCKSTFVGA